MPGLLEEPCKLCSQVAVLRTDVANEKGSMEKFEEVQETIVAIKSDLADMKLVKMQVQQQQKDLRVSLHSGDAELAVHKHQLAVKGVVRHNKLTRC